MRELRICHQDEKIQVSIKTIFKERENVFYHRQWLAGGLQYTMVFDGKRSSLLGNSLIDSCGFRADDLFSVHTNADKSCSNFMYITYH